MPVPIRPVKEMQDRLPSILDPSSALQRALLGGDAQQVIRLQPISKIESRDADILHQIWLANDLRIASEGTSNRMFRIPDSISDYDVIRLKTAGHIVGKGRDVEFTADGDKVVKKKILESSSEFDLERTKDKYERENVMRKK